MIEPFYVNLPQKVLDDLHFKIKLTRWPEVGDNTDWTHGTDISYLKVLSDYWLREFDWRKTENEINRYPNFIADISSIRIHFIHVRGKGKRSIPLIISHGWPGSFLEMMKLIPLLTEDPDLSFDLVIPSIPGFGFSTKTPLPGCNSSVVADLWHELMTKLGYDSYGVQGGDIGSGISTWMALRYPKHVIGLHLNYISGSFKPYIPDDDTVSDEVLEFRKSAQDWSAKEGAYALLQSTKPLSLAYGLNDSPVGLCAWIIEKFNGWSDNSGCIDNAFAKDEILANVTLYWVTETIYSSMKIYNENTKKPLAFGKDDFVRVPVGFAEFPKELPVPPRSQIEKGFNITHWTVMPKGGHFAAAEQPGLLSDDIKIFFFKSLNDTVKITHLG
jgi:pimeloyl-ACP methyl ester carboxylesterase